MVESIWGDWFIDEVESTDPDRFSVWYLGCNGFILRTCDTTIYIDPYFGKGDPPHTVRMIPVPMDPEDASLCDGVLVTHEHVDHMHPPSYSPLIGERAEIYAPEKSYTQPDYDGELMVSEENKNVVETGDSFDIGDFSIHVRGANDPDSVEPVSYVVEYDDLVFFHPGDSKPADEFDSIGSEFDIDLGVLAFGSVGNLYYPEEKIRKSTKWYMDENEVIEAANSLRLSSLLPSHYDMWRGMTADPSSLNGHASSYPYPKNIEIASVGDRLEVGKNGVIPSGLEE